MEKTKSNSTIKRRILVTCTSGTEQHPILKYLLKTLLARHAAGDNLNNAQPLFGVPIKPTHTEKATFLPLCYTDIVQADKIRTDILGYSDINFRTHLRRRGGASDLFDAGCSLRDIKIVGH